MGNFYLFFQERYRSNSLDSILVSDVSNRPPKPVLPNRNSAFEFKTPSPGAHAPSHFPPFPPGYDPPNSHHQPLFTKKYPPPTSNRTLEKRPTFDSLDKRKSWSVDTKLTNAGRFDPLKQTKSASNQQQYQRGGSGPDRNVLRNAKGQSLQQVQQQLHTTKG